jgi:hypothetical protein
MQPSNIHLNSTPSIINCNNQANHSSNPVNINMTTPNLHLNNTTVSKLNAQQQITNGLFIRKEIQRFESVHPNIYTVYDLIDSISDMNLQQKIREHIVNIEGMLVF